MLAIGSQAALNPRNNPETSSNSKNDTPTKPNNEPKRPQ
ncbi:hypothetical protein Nizo2766_0220 [Lactiplantibacillus plantarum]|nr:hypothetical protein Nizo2766_0220 [Lactiplantibacillus plantarum]